MYVSSERHPQYMHKFIEISIVYPYENSSLQNGYLLKTEHSCRSLLIGLMSDTAYRLLRLAIDVSQKLYLFIK